jgi:hypothetical protein
VNALKRPDVIVGLIAGILLYAHATLPHSLSWPFLWPLLGGAAAIVWIARQRVERVSVASMLQIGLRVGAMAAVVATLGAVATMPFILRGEGLPKATVSIAIVGIVAAMVFALPAAMIGSTLAGVLLRVNWHGQRRNGANRPR